PARRVIAVVDGAASDHAAGLLEEECSASGFTLGLERASPFQLHRSRLAAGLAAADHPVDALGMQRLEVRTHAAPLPSNARVAVAAALVGAAQHHGPNERLAAQEANARGNLKQ